MIRWALVILSLAVVTGAFGAHMLRKLLTADHLESWNTAVEYQFYHGLGMLLIGVASANGILQEKRALLASRLMAAGILMFSGSIYLLSTREIHGMNISWLGPVTPVGGVCFIAAWLISAAAVQKKN